MGIEAGAAAFDTFVGEAAGGEILADTAAADAFAGGVVADTVAADYAAFDGVGASGFGSTGTIGAAAAGLTMGNIASGVGIASGVNALTGGALTNALGLGTSAADAQRLADPFSKYRDQLGAMYAGALQPGAQTDITKMPGYSQFQSGIMDPAMQATERAGAAKGMTYSGNEMQALQKTGQQGYSGFMNDYMNRLATGSGATQGPAQAAGMGFLQQNMQQQGIMQGIGAVATGVGGLYNLPA